MSSRKNIANEPRCAVLAALESGELDSRRLESYQKLERETSYDGLSSKEIEVKKSEGMFKDVGGMKILDAMPKNIENGKRYGRPILYMLYN